MGKPKLDIQLQDVSFATSLRPIFIYLPILDVCTKMFPIDTWDTLTHLQMPEVAAATTKLQDPVAVRPSQRRGTVCFFSPVTTIPLKKTDLNGMRTLSVLEFDPMLSQNVKHSSWMNQPSNQTQVDCLAFTPITSSAMVLYYAVPYFLIELL